MGAQAQPTEFGIEASSAAAMLPILVLPNRRPAIMVSRSKMRRPLVSHFGHKTLGGWEVKLNLQLGQILSFLALRNAN